MIEDSIYSEIIKSKTQDLIPVFKNGKTVDSRYDPKKEAARIIQTINSKSNFYIVLGIASGILINELLQSKPNSFIFAIEKCEQDIEFLTQIPLIKELSKNIHVCFTTIDSIVQNLINYYLPSFYDSFEIIEQRGWISENLNLLETIKNLSTKLDKKTAENEILRERIHNRHKFFFGGFFAEKARILLRNQV